MKNLPGPQEADNYQIGDTQEYFSQDNDRSISPPLKVESPSEDDKYSENNPQDHVPPFFREGLPVIDSNTGVVDQLRLLPRADANVKVPEDVRATRNNA